MMGTVSKSAMQMPRKPKPPADLIVQMLSTGEFVQAEHVLDDFDGTEVKLVRDHGLPKPPADLQAVHHMRREQARRDKLALLQRVGIAERPEPKLAHNQTLTKSGLVLTPKRGPNALKRRF